MKSEKGEKGWKGAESSRGVRTAGNEQQAASEDSQKYCFWTAASLYKVAGSAYRKVVGVKVGQ